MSDNRLGFEALELGDNVTDSFDRKGVVAQVGRELVVLREDYTWKYADDYIAGAKEHDNPYRVERRDWDLDNGFHFWSQASGDEVDLNLSFENCTIEGVKPGDRIVFAANGHSEEIVVPEHEGTDLEPRV
ncbi:hypothetical protein [Jiangella anatolica]|uniref:Uncharacterized protein n=1 Tax=Jiangella anatolica TaxID=2670374 RepID=A0A2W2B6Z5_9ACTN|nr:hypothetical protein [Jiangella anatolica]PZF83241.1 hypothetical protein C1I92_13265 [Jiangella anatolica]